MYTTVLINSHNRFFFSKYKAGFLPSHSTVCQLLEIYHFILESIDVDRATCKSCCMVFCDLSKVFYRVRHKSLINVSMPNRFDKLIVNQATEHNKSCIEIFFAL